MLLLCTLHVAVPVSLLSYPVVEVQCVSDVLAEQYAVAVCGRAEEMVADLRQRPPPSDATLLRSCTYIQYCHSASNIIIGLLGLTKKLKHT